MKEGQPKIESSSSGVVGGGGDDWRKSVPQSYRSEEVRNISKVLASLEPGATSSSKLMLAMRFEQSIFSSAVSLADYRKRLLKRLKRLQKSYVPPSEQKEDGEREKERQLRDRFGSELKFIQSHSQAAIRFMAERHGKDRALHLKQHLDNAEQWAVEIGIPPSTHNQHLVKRVPREPNYLQRIEGHLEQRVENIRSHVVKLVKPDTFLSETLDKLSQQELTQTNNTEITLLENLSTRTQHFLQQELLQTTTTTTTTTTTITAQDYEKKLPSLMERMARIVPASTKEACFAHLEKLRVALQTMVLYLALPLNSKHLYHSSLTKSHTVAVDSLYYLQQYYAPLIKEQNKEYQEKQHKKDGTLQISHIWERAMVYPNNDNSTTTTTTTTNTASTLPKLALTSRVLLVGGRNPPKHLVPALRSKKARVILQDDYHYVSFQIENLLEFQIRLAPLLVTIHLIHHSNNNNAQQQEEQQEQEQKYEKELQYASTKATYVLRRCFGEKLTSSNVTYSANDFETEISEGTALLKFLDLARNSYTPNWAQNESNAN